MDKKEIRDWKIYLDKKERGEVILKISDLSENFEKKNNPKVILKELSRYWDKKFIHHKEDSELF